MLAKCYMENKYFKDAYSASMELYHTVKNERDEKSLGLVVEAVGMIKHLLEMNQEHEGYLRFIDN